MLGSEGRKVVASRDNAAIQDNQVIFSGGQHNRLLGACAQGEAGQEDSEDEGDLLESAGFEETSKHGIMEFITPQGAPCEANSSVFRMIFISAALQIQT